MWRNPELKFTAAGLEDARGATTAACVCKRVPWCERKSSAARRFAFANVSKKKLAPAFSVREKKKPRFARHRTWLVVGRRVVRDRIRPIGPMRSRRLARGDARVPERDRTVRERPASCAGGVRIGERRPRALSTRSRGRSNPPVFDVDTGRDHAKKTPSSCATRSGNGAPRPPRGANTPSRGRTRRPARVSEHSRCPAVFVALGPRVVGAFRARPDA